MEDREAQQRQALENIEKATYLDKLEQQDSMKKKQRHRQELEQLIEERAQQKKFKD